MSMPAILSLWLNRSSTRYPFSLVIFDMQVLLPFQSIFCINTPPVIKIPEVGKTITYTPSWHALTHLYVLLSAQWLACLPLCGCWIMNNWMWEQCTFKRWHTVHTVNLELDNNHPISNPQGWLFQLHAARKNNPIRIHTKKTNILHFELIILFNNTLLTQGLYSKERHIKVLEGGNHSQASLIQRKKAGGSQVV